MPEGISSSLVPDGDALFETAACALIVTDSHGLIIKANRTFCIWVGRTAEMIVDQVRIQDLLTMGGKIFHQTHWAPLLAMQGSIGEVKLEVVHADGRTIPMILNAVIRERAGRVFHELALFVAEDRHRYEDELLRAKKRAEELASQLREGHRLLIRAQTRLEVALSSAELVVWETDIKTGDRSFDAGIASLLQLPPDEQITAQAFLQAIVPEDREREAQAFRAAMDSAARTYQCVFSLMAFDGKRRTVQMTGAKILDERGALSEFVGVLLDITDELARRAAAEDRALFAEQMVGIVSHDLRNPLGTIHLSAQALSRMSNDSRQSQTVERIKTSVTRANRLIGDLLDFTEARIGRGLSMRMQPMNLHECVADCLSELSGAYPQRELLHIKVGTGPCVGDVDRLAQLLGNLVSNAMSYGARDRPVTVTSRLGNGSYALEVHNEGDPIPQEALPTLFAPMQRGPNVRAENKSVGLGLFIVQEIANAHRGDVSVTSSAEAGTRFTFVAPAVLDTDMPRDNANDPARSDESH